MSEVGCVVCRKEDSFVSSDGADCYKIVCSGCGTYRITGSASRSLVEQRLADRQVANARGWLRENQFITLTSDDLPELRSLKSPSVAERAEKLLVALNEAAPVIGTTLQISRTDDPDSRFWCARSWSLDANELTYLLRQYLTQTKQWLEEIIPAGSKAHVQITPAGYDHLETIRVGDTDRVSGFCAMWFSPEVTSAWTNAIKPAINAAGYEAVRIDGVEHNNKIDDEILANIRASRFVVADFTGERGGVYFEAGFAMGLGCPVIWTVREDWLSRVHFDNRQYNFVVWKPDELPEFAKRLQLRIEATIGRGPL